MRPTWILVVALLASGCGSEKKRDRVSNESDRSISNRTQPPPTKQEEDPPSVPDNLTSTLTKSTVEKPPKPLSEEQRIASFIETYLATPTAERGKYTVDPDVFEAAQEAYYKNLRTPNDLQVTVSLIQRGPKKGYLTVKVTVRSDLVRQNMVWYLVKVDNGFKVDWSANVGYNPVAFKAWEAGTERAVTLRVVAKLSDYYNYQYSNAKGTHYSLQLAEDFGDRYDSFHGYVPKDSALGKRLFGIVKDGQEHRLTITIERTGPETSVVGIDDLVSESWVR